MRPLSIFSIVGLLRFHRIAICRGISLEDFGVELRGWWLAFLSEIDSTKAALAKLLDYGVLVKIVAIALVLEDILLVKAQTRTSKHWPLRRLRLQFIHFIANSVKSLSHCDHFALLQRRSPHSGPLAEVQRSFSQFGLKRFDFCQFGFLIGVVVVVARGRCRKGLLAIDKGVLQLPQSKWSFSFGYKICDVARVFGFCGHYTE